LIGSESQLPTKPSRQLDIGIGNSKQKVNDFVGDLLSKIN
jgi:hypothetical protein